MSTTNDPRMQDYQPMQPANQNVAYEEQAQGVNDNTVISSNAGGVYSQRQYENSVDTMGNQIEKRVEVFEDKNQSRTNIRYWITMITYFVLSVLETVLLLRLVFRLLGANQGNNFILFLYNLSHVFVAAFNGIFNDQALGRNGVFEISTVIAMLVYVLLAWGIVSLSRMLFAPVPTSRQIVTTTHSDRSL